MMTLGGPPPQRPTTSELLDRAIDQELALNADIGNLNSKIEKLQFEVTDMPPSSQKQSTLSEINNLQNELSEHVRRLESIKKDIEILENTISGEDSLRTEGK